MNLLRFYAFLRAATYLLKALALVILVYGIVSQVNLLLSNLMKGAAGSQVTVQFITQVIVYLALWIVIWYIGDNISQYAEQVYSRLTERVLGLVQLGGSTIMLSEIASHLGLTLQQLIQIIEELASKGKLSNYVLDMQQQILTHRENVVKDIIDYQVEIRAKLVELEKMRKENKISEEAYKVLVDEIQKARKIS